MINLLTPKYARSSLNEFDDSVVVRLPSTDQSGPLNVARFSRVHSGLLLQPSPPCPLQLVSVRNVRLFRMERRLF